MILFSKIYRQDQNWLTQLPWYLKRFAMREHIFFSIKTLDKLFRYCQTKEQSKLSNSMAQAKDGWMLLKAWSEVYDISKDMVRF